MTIKETLTALFDRIPRRHSTDNVKEINAIIAEYEDCLQSIEAINAFYEQNTPAFFDELDNIKATVKRSNDNKASKKLKDTLFDEASGLLKDTVQALITLYGDGNRTV